MRNAAMVGLTLLVSTTVLGADKPIPQDAARMEKRSRERLEWNRQTTVGAYEKVGKKSPKWDGPAREALDLAARMYSSQADQRVTHAEIHVPAKKAIEAGCDDPMILYVYYRSSVGSNYPKQEEYARRRKAAADAMSASRYPPFRRAAAVSIEAETLARKKDATPEERQQAERGLDAALDLIAASATEDPRGQDWEERWYERINAIIAAFRQMSGDYKAAYDRVDAKLAKAKGIEALRLTVRGNFFYHWGWEARTNAFAVNVGPERFRTFEQRIREAHTALEAAWKAKPGEPHVATLMLDIEKSVGDGDRAAMETWFERAMTTDGNDYAACLTKLDWLDPKWHGDEKGEEMLAFGKACRATKNWRVGITLLAADAQLRYSTKIPREQQRPYLGSPAVWNEIRDIYDEYLKHFPDNNVARSKYAALGYIAGHYIEANEQFEKLGDRLTTWPTFPNFTLPMLKNIRDEVAKWVATNRPDVKAKAGAPGNP